MDSMPLSPRAPPPEQGDRDDRSSPTVELLSPLLPGAGSDGIPDHVAAPRRLGARHLWCGKDDRDAPAVCTVCRRWPMLASTA